MYLWFVHISCFYITFYHQRYWSWLDGEKAGDNPWRALTLEWTTTSPPAIENFDQLPVLSTGPYDYGVVHQGVNPDAVLLVETDESYPAIEQSSI